MTLIIDLEAVPFACPACGSPFPAYIGPLKNNPSLACAECGRSADAEAAALSRRITLIRRRLVAFQQAVAMLEPRELLPAQETVSRAADVVQTEREPLLAPQ